MTPAATDCLHAPRGIDTDAGRIAALAVTTQMPEATSSTSIARPRTTHRQLAIHRGGSRDFPRMGGTLEANERGRGHRTAARAER